MANDLSGGLRPEQDMVLPGPPDDPEMRESVSVWMFADDGSVVFPRLGVEAEASSWDQRRLQFAATFPDGRTLNGAGVGPAPSPFDGAGRPAVIGAGGIAFRCVEPFRRWTMTYDGEPLDGTVEEQIAGTYGRSGRRARVRLDAELEMVTPAWVQEYAITPEMSEIEAANAAAMGLGYRLEHHFRATGTLSVDGASRDFTATGTRIHRQSVRRLEGFAGHSWLSAVFPDGRAFGCLAYPPRDGSDGEYSYNDAVIYADGRLLPARITKAPFLRRIVPSGDDVTVELESALGRTVVEGTTTIATFRIGNPDMGGGLDMQQGAARFRWDGQEAYGMVERSSHHSLTSLG